MERTSTWRVALLAVVAVAVMCGGLWAIPAVREALGAALSGDLPRLRATVDGNPVSAALVLFGLAMIHVVVPFPAEIPNTAAGYALGIAAGIPVMLGAWVVSAIAGYGLGRAAGRPVLERLIGARRLDRAERVVARGGSFALLGARLIPLIPFTLISIACGITRVPLGRFVWTSALGTLPLTSATVLLGTRLQEPRLDDPVIWGSVAAVLFLVAILHPLAKRLDGSE